MLVQPPGDAGDENGRDKDRRENEGKRHHRSGNFVHGLKRGCFGRHAILDMALGGFDHDDGVVHYQADGEHETQERQGVESETEDREKREGADERDGNCHQRDERGAPALQKNEDDDDDEDQRDNEGAHDVMHARGHGEGGIKRDDVVEVGREALLEFRHQLQHAMFIIERIGVRQLVDRHDGRGIAI